MFHFVPNIRRTEVVDESLDVACDFLLSRVLDL